MNLKTLNNAVTELVIFATCNRTWPQDDIWHRMTNLAAAIKTAASNGAPPDDILAAIEPARTIMRQSPFFARICDWPDGVGDWKTVRMMMHREIPDGTTPFGAAYSQWAYNLPIVEQHRQKLAYCAAHIHRIAQTQQPPLRILSSGSGSAIEIVGYASHLPEGTHIVLSDMSADALTQAQSQLDQFGHIYVETIHGNVFHEFRRLALLGTYDLVYFSGLADYLSDDTLKNLIDTARDWIYPGGLLHFSNLDNHDWTIYTEILANWRLNTRSRDDLLALAPDATINLDPTGNTWLVDIPIK